MEKIKQFFGKRPLWFEIPLVLIISKLMMEIGVYHVGEIFIKVQIGPNDVWRTIWMYMLFGGIWVITLLYLWLVPGNKPILKVLWTEPEGNRIKCFLLGLVLGTGFNCLCIFGAWLNGDLKLYFDAVRPAALIISFAAFFIQCSAEELICRGFLYQRVIGRTGKFWAAAIISSLFFAYNHIHNPGITALALADIALIGILLSLLVYYLDSLWCAFAFHTAWNFNQNITFGLPNSGWVPEYSVVRLDAASASDSFFYNVGFGVEGTWFSFVLFSAAIAGLILWGRKHGRQPLNIWKDGYLPQKRSKAQ